MKKKNCCIESQEAWTRGAGDLRQPQAPFLAWGRDSSSSYPSDVDALDTLQIRENTSPWHCASSEKMSFGEQEALRRGHGDPGGVEMLFRLRFSLESPGGAFSTLSPRRDPSPVQSGPLVRGHRVRG